MIKKLCAHIEKNWKKDLLVLLILLILVPLAVCGISPHCKSEITADGILEYIVGGLSFVSTLTLSALALWQTQQIQKEADDAQDKMKRIAKDANEIQLTSQIIDYHFKSLLELENAIYKYLSENVPSRVLDRIKAKDQVSEFKDRNRSNGEQVKRLLDHFQIHKESKKKLFEYIDQLNALIDEDCSQKAMTLNYKIVLARCQFENQTVDFTLYVNNMIQKALLKKHSLEEIRMLFSEDMEEQ